MPTPVDRSSDASTFVFTGRGAEAMSHEVDAKAVAREQDAHLVSDELEAEAMPKLDMEAVANELDVVL
jgi:hypothetical protein